MLYLLVIVLVVVYFIKISDVNNSIEKLKSDVNKLRQQIEGENYSSKTASNQTSQSHVSEVEKFEQSIYSDRQNLPVDKASNSARSSVSKIEDAPNLIAEWFKENWLLKIGVLMILVGFGWFVSYAFINNWIGPVGRIAIGIVAGSLITIFGTVRLGKNHTQGILFTILGSALVVISVLAGQSFYNFFSPLMVLGIVFLVSLYVSFTAVAFSVEKLAVYGLIVSLLAPALAGLQPADLVLIYFYLFVVSASTIWVSIVKGWRMINPIGILGVALYGVSIISNSHYLFDSESSKYIVLMTSYVVSFLYLFVGAWSLAVSKDGEKGATSADVFLTIVSTLLILTFTLSLVPTIFQSLTLALWMIIFAVIGFVVFQKTKNEKLFFIYSLIAILFLGIATSVELSGKTLIIAFAIEAAIVSIASYIVTNRIKIAQVFGFLMILPMLMSFESIASHNWSYYSGMGILHADFAVLLLMSILLLVLGLFYKENNKKENNSEFRLDNIALIISTVYLYIIVWLSAHSLLLNSDTAVFISLFIYTIVGLVTYFVGLFHENDVLKKYGAAMLILVVLRLVFIDVWRMELVLRVITFVVLGVMFISTAFISKEHKSHLNAGESEINKN